MYQAEMLCEGYAWVHILRVYILRYKCWIYGVAGVPRNVGHIIFLLPVKGIYLQMLDISCGSCS